MIKLILRMALFYIGFFALGMINFFSVVRYILDVRYKPPSDEGGVCEADGGRDKINSTF